MMCGPNLGQYFGKQHQEECYGNQFDRKIDPEAEIVMVQPVVDQQVGYEDDADVHEGAGDHHGSL